jgi:hypothetical protein
MLEGVASEIQKQARVLVVRDTGLNGRTGPWIEDPPLAGKWRAYLQMARTKQQPHKHTDSATAPAREFVLAQARSSTALVCVACGQLDLSYRACWHRVGCR